MTRKIFAMFFILGLTLLPAWSANLFVEPVDTSASLVKEVASNKKNEYGNKLNSFINNKVINAQPGQYCLYSQCEKILSKAPVQYAQVFFVTDRLIGKDKKYGRAYQNSPDESNLHFGISGLVLPKSTSVKATKDERAIQKALAPKVDWFNKIRWHFKAPQIIWTNEFRDQGKTSAETQFIAGLRERLSRSSVKKVILFAPGSYSSFADGLQEASGVQISNIDAPVVAYCWTSKGNTITFNNYVQDEVLNNWSSVGFNYTLDLLTREFGPENVVVAAHSMGNRIILSSLLRRQDRQDGFREALAQLSPEALKQVTVPNDLRPLFLYVSFSPDVDTRTVKHLYANCLRGATDGVVIFASSKDIPLTSSKFVHRGSRLGSFPGLNKIPFIPGVTFINFSKADVGGYGHSIPYFALPMLLLEHGLPAPWTLESQRSEPSPVYALIKQQNKKQK